MKIHRALIVDDERLARKALIGLLRAHPQVQVVGEAGDVPSAVAAIERWHPDTVFLDIQMPGPSGLDLPEAAGSGIRYIFVTAYDQYAVKAFEAEAVDYLLKPVHRDRLAQTVARLDSGAKAPAPRTVLAPEDSLFLLVGRKFRFIKVKNILAVRAEGDYSEILLADGSRGLTSKSMRDWERRLPERLFIRIHRSTIINIDAVESVEDWFASTFSVRLKNISEPFVVSRRHAARMKEILG